jgi:Flp pilus assembly protein TadG
MCCTDFTKNEAGYALVTVALLLFVLISFVALAVDLGIAYSARTAAQRTADAAALAGAFTFVIDPNPDETDIKNRAVEQAAVNGILGTPVVITAGDVTVDMVNRRVTVNVERTQARGNPIPTYFSQILMPSIDVQVVATAEASPAANADGCTKPWVLPSTAFSPPGLTPCEACESNQVLVRNGAVTSWAKSTMFAQGVQAAQYMVKPQSPHDALLPSNFYAIELEASGAAAYRTAIASCVDIDTACGDTYRVEPGNMVGPTEQGVNDLLGDNVHSYTLSSGEHRFQTFGGQNYDTSHQLVTVPVWDACDDPLFQTDAGAGKGKGKGGCECPAECVAPGNNTWYTVDGYARVFVEGMGNIGGSKGDGVIVRLIGLDGCTGSSLAEGETGPFAIPVRLVRAPDNGT